MWCYAACKAKRWLCFFIFAHGGVLWQKIKKKEEITVIDIPEEYLKERIYEIRGQRVILDADLSEIYGYTTKAFNQQVKNNIEKFDEDFMFELTDDDVENLRSIFLTANLNSKSRYNLHVFTE